MKNKYMLIILLCIILGTLIGMSIKDIKSKEQLVISKDNITKKEIKITKKSLKKLEKEKKNLSKETESLKIKYMDLDSIKEVENLKQILSYTSISGKGVIITIDAINEEVGNIANTVDYNKILVNLVNILKSNGGKFISINNQRINQYSGIVLAGNHINVNYTPIAQPYIIKVIGDIEKLSGYLNKNDNYLDNIALNYLMKVEYKIDENISMSKIESQNISINTKEE